MHCLTASEIFFTGTGSLAKVNGSSAKLEHHAGNDRIGFWTSAEDRVEWKYDASRWGKYRVRLTYSTASPDGTEIAYVYRSTNFSEIFVMSADGSNSRRLTRSQSSSEASPRAPGWVTASRFPRRLPSS